MTAATLRPSLARTFGPALAAMPGMCGSALAPFCVGCGARIHALPSRAIGCPHCGVELVRIDGTLATRSRLVPWIKAGASAVLPGSGQVLNGQPVKGLAFLLTCWLVVPWIWSVVDAWRVARRAALAPVRSS